MYRGVSSIFYASKKPPWAVSPEGLTHGELFRKENGKVADVTREAAGGTHDAANPPESTKDIVEGLQVGALLAEIRIACECELTRVNVASRLPLLVGRKKEKGAGSRAKVAQQLPAHSNANPAHV